VTTFRARFDQGDGTDLRHVTADGQPVLERLYFALRDEQWRTIALQVTERRLVENVQGFDLTVRAESADPAYPLHVDLHYAATESGLVGEFTARTGAAYRYCRLGFCLLHPVSNHPGRPAAVRQRGDRTDVTFPVEIEPQREVAGVPIPMWGAAFDRIDVELDGSRVQIELVGDEFEMEDQRNWSDASFKTYCTPASLGSPLLAEAGQTFTQSVRITYAADDRDRTQTADRAPDAVVVGPPIGVLPTVALWDGVPGLEEWRPQGGFVELNSLRPPPPPEARSLGFGINGAVHAADRWSILESTVTHGTIVGQAKQLCPDLPIQLGPVDFADQAMDWMDAAGTVVDRPLEPATDPRRGGTLGIAYLVASLASLATDAPTRATYFDQSIADSPTAAVVAELARLAGRQVLGVSAPAGVAALAIDTGTEVELRLVNLRGEPADVRLPDGRLVELEDQGVATLGLGRDTVR
jgi:hypothetical protein